MRAPNIAFKLAGKDRLHGGADDDKLDGGPGNDKISVGLDAGPHKAFDGDEIIGFSAGFDTVTANALDRIEQDIVASNREKAIVPESGGLQ